MPPITVTRHPTEDELALLITPPFGFHGWWTGLVPASAVWVTVFLVLLLLTAFLEGPPPWAVPSALIVGLVGAVWWYITILKQEQRAAEERAAERAKVAEGDVVSTTYTIQDAIAVEEFEDEGLNFYLLLDDMRTLFLTGQYLYQPVEDGFPWRSFEIVRVPGSAWVLTIKALGEALRPSHTRRPFTSTEFQRNSVPADGSVEPLDWESLKTAAA